jgi:hypothetical protein
MSRAIYQADPIGGGALGMTETVYKYVDGTLDGQWDVGTIVGIPSSIFVDFTRRALYVGKFETAKVDRYDLDGACSGAAQP